MVLGTAFRWSNSATIVVSVVLAFLRELPPFPSIAG
jgi:hypothetical protein